MKKIYLFVASFSLLLAPVFKMQAQVAVSTDGLPPHTSAMLDVRSTNKGLLLPRMTTAQRTTLGVTAIGGLMVYDTDLNRYYYHNGTSWEVASMGGLWSLNGTGTSIYTTDLTDRVGIGTSAPKTPLEVYSGWPQARLTSTSSGSFLQFAGTSAIDWGVGSWADQFRITSTGNDFSSTTDEFVFSTTDFRPFFTNNKTLGTDVYRWSTIFGINGTFSGKLGVGTTNPTTNFEVVGPLNTARLTSTTQGAYLQFASTSATEWAIGTWQTSMRMSSTTDGFVGITDEYYFSTTEFTPWSGNTKLLGSTSKRWSAVNSVDGSFSGNVDVQGNVDAQGNVIAQSNAVVGSTSVLGKLHVHDGATHRAAMYITPMTTTSGDSAMIFLAEDDNAYYGMYWLYEGTGNDMELYGKSGTTIYGPHFQVDRISGNVAIGSTYASGYRLSVEGKVICTELRVNLVANWPDYVFRPDYKLMPVEELGSFVRANGHLPNVPPAAEIESSGMDVGQMQRLMMEKIEELSLYIIQQQEQIKELRDQLNKKDN